MNLKSKLAQKLPRNLINRIKADLGLSGYPNWKEIIKSSDMHWPSELEKVREKGLGRILIATSTGAHRAGNITESAIAASLILRGYDVDVLLCDAALPACIMAEYQFVKNDMQKYFDKGPSEVGLCYGCHKMANDMWSELGVNILKYSDFISITGKTRYQKLSNTLSIGDMLSFVDEEGANVGEHAKSGALRFLCKGDLVDGDWQSEQALRRYFYSSLITNDVMQGVFGSGTYQAMVCFHGIYVPHGVIGEAARRNNVRVVNWNTSYRKRRFIFSHSDTYHKTMCDEGEEDWFNFNFTAEKRKSIVEYLESREKGGGDWQQFNENPEESVSLSPALTGLDFSKPIVTLLPNVVWDAQLHYKSNIFSNLIEWALFSVKYFSSRPDLQLIIRVHPAEVKRFSPTRQPLEKEIRNRFPDLPSNVFIVPAEDKVSTYRLAEVSNTILIYGTKTGIELAARGQNVIVCGEAWIKNKGFTYDPKSIDEYHSLLESLPFKDKLSEGQTERALRFAYHFFSRRAIYLEFLKETKDAMSFRLNLVSLEQLLPGNFSGLDIICDGISGNRKFIEDY